MTELGRTQIGKLLASAMMMLVLFMNFPSQAFADTLSVSLTANGQTGSLTLATSTDSFAVALSATGATACQMTSPAASGVATNMSSTIDPTHPWYPAIGGSTTFTVTCTDGVNNSSSSVVVSLPAATSTGSTGSTGSGSGTLSVDIKANGSDGPVTLAAGQPYSYSWTSTGATACQLTSPQPSGISTSGTSAVIDPSHPWYPSTTTPTTLSITCTDGVSNASDSVVVQLASAASSGVTADIKANGSDGPIVTITPGSSWTYSWSSTGATACQLTSPAASGISTSGTSAAITPGHPWYPTSASSTTLTIVCTNGVANASDSVTVALGSGSGGGGSNPAVTVLINGTHAATINNGDSWTYTWNSQNATACQQTSPVASGISTSGTSSPITLGHPWYPAVGSTTTITVTCTNGVSNATDSATVTVVATSTPPGGGGSTGCTGNCGGSSSSSSSSSSTSYGTSIPPVSTGAACLFVRDYMRADFQNNPVEVMKLQAFLKVFEGYDYVSINGIYDAATVQAVDAFQLKYRADILDPWGLKGPTGYTYILTLKKVNELYCLHAFPLNQAQQEEIKAFRDLVTGLRAQGINPELPAGASRTITVPVTSTETITLPGGITATTTATTTLTIPIVGSATTTNKGQSTSTLAAVLFAAPQGGVAVIQCIYEFLLILIVLYILGNVLEDVLYKQTDPAKARARFYAKWITILVGLLVAGVVAYLVGEWCLILPLLIALIFSLVWMALYPKHTGTYAGAKTWIAARSAVAKSAVEKTTTTTTTTVENKPAA